MIREYFIELGLNVAKNKILDIKKQHDIRDRLDAFIDRKLDENYSCSLEEELDFGGLIEYISGSFLNDMEKRLFGNLRERRAAHKTIVEKAIAYSQSTKALSRKRATKLISDAMCILHDFYRVRANKDLLFVAAEIEDTILTEMSEEHNQQTSTILKRLDAIEKTNLSARDIVSIEKGLELVGSGQISTIEEKMTQLTNAMSSGHILFPHYGFRLNTVDGKIQYQSVPLSNEAAKEYPPSVKCIGTVRVGTGYLKELTPATVNYANRHQLPIVIDIKKAEKYLGNVLDPVQHDAEELIGEEITIPPKPFPPAFPCSISFDDEVVFNYLLFRTKEILDDDTIVISNYEQEKCPYQITVNMHPQNKTIDFSFQKNDSANNKDSLKYAFVMKKAILGTKMTMKLLESDEVFAEGIFKNFNYNGGFSSVDEEIDFLSRVVDIEKYFERVINIPNDLYQSDWDAVYYISDLLRGQTRYGEWKRHIFTFNVSDDLKKSIATTEDKEFSLSYVGIAKVPLWGEFYEVPIARTFEAGKFENLESLKEKIAVLENGDSIEAIFVASGTSGKWSDVLCEKDTCISN